MRVVKEERQSSKSSEVSWWPSCGDSKDNTCCLLRSTEYSHDTHCVRDPDRLRFPSRRGVYRLETSWHKGAEIYQEGCQQSSASFATSALEKQFQAKLNLTRIPDAGDASKASRNRDVCPRCT